MRSGTILESAIGRSACAVLTLALHDRQLFGASEIYVQLYTKQTQLLSLLIVGKKNVCRVKLLTVCSLECVL